MDNAEIEMSGRTVARQYFQLLHSLSMLRLVTEKVSLTVENGNGDGNKGLFRRAGVI